MDAGQLFEDINQAVVEGEGGRVCKTRGGGLSPVLAREIRRARFNRVLFFFTGLGASPRRFIRAK